MMLHLMDGLAFKLHHIVVVLFLMRHCAALSKVVTNIGEDVLLSYHLGSPVDSSKVVVEWSRPDLKPRYVYVLRNGVELVNTKNPSYKGRTLMSMDKLKLGDVSLKLSRVKLSDGGTYRCYLPTVGVEFTVELVVGATSAIVVTLAKDENEETLSGGGGVVLQCESAGWYPEPEVLWLDAEGNLLSARPPETVRGPDDLYTVSSRVTVDKRHNNSFTCRVQQNNINQTREAHIRITGDVFVPGNSPVGPITISLTVMFIVVLAVVFVVVKWRQRSKNVKSSTAGPSRNHEEVQLVEEEREKLQVTGQSQNISDLDEKETNLNKELKTLEEEYIYVVEIVHLLMEKKNDVENEMGSLKILRDETQSEQEANIKRENGKTRRVGLKSIEDIITDLETKKKHIERELETKEVAHKSLVYVVNMLIEKRKVLNDRMQEINKQLKEIKKQRDEVQAKISSDQTQEQNKNKK